MNTALGEWATVWMKRWVVPLSLRESLWVTSHWVASHWGYYESQRATESHVSLCRSICHVSPRGLRCAPDDVWSWRCVYHWQCIRHAVCLLNVSAILLYQPSSCTVHVTLSSSILLHRSCSSYIVYPLASFIWLFHRLSSCIVHPFVSAKRSALASNHREIARL